MDLPMEIRSKIYSYLFPPSRVEILRLKPPLDSKSTSQTHRYRLYHVLLPPRNPKTQHQTSLPRSSTVSSNTNPTSKPDSNRKNQQKQLRALLLTSKQTYTDTLTLLYSTTQFVFRSPRATSRFLETVNPTAQAAIRHVELFHTMYNEPRLVKFRWWKLRSDMAWYIVCDDIAVQWTSLEVLHVSLTVFDSPLRLQIGERWSLPLLVFAGRQKKVRFARVKLGVRGVSPEQVKTVEAELERELMDPAAVKVRDDERLLSELRGPVKATKVLRLVFQ